MTEHEKMQQELWYDANNDKELLNLREDAEELCYLLNQTSPKMKKKREEISYKNNNWNKTFNLEENQSGKDFIIIENILKNKSDYNMYQIVILQENNNLYVKKIQRK